jgi:hypothetical protein
MHLAGAAVHRIILVANRGHMRRRRLFKTLHFLFPILILAVIFPGGAPCQEATLTNIIVTNTRDDLLVYMNVEGAFTEEMKEAILSGVPATFSFIVRLYMARNFWLDKEMADLEVTHTIKYDNLKKEFEVRRSWEKNRPRITKSFAEARNWMSEISSLPVAPLADLQKGTQYQLRLKAQLREVTLPFYLHYVLFFVSLWDFETDWYSIDFIY